MQDRCSPVGQQAQPRGPRITLSANAATSRRTPSRSETAAAASGVNGLGRNVRRPVSLGLPPQSVRPCAGLARRMRALDPQTPDPAGCPRRVIAVALKALQPGSCRRSSPAAVWNTLWNELVSNRVAKVDEKPNPRQPPRLKTSPSPRSGGVLIRRPAARFGLPRSASGSADKVDPGFANPDAQVDHSSRTEIIAARRRPGVACPLIGYSSPAVLILVTAAVRLVTPSRS